METCGSGCQIGFTWPWAAYRGQIAPDGDGGFGGESLLMKPGRRDIRHKVLITGDELRELKRHTGSMAEAFGLDSKIEAYKGTRPITLYRWDLEGLLDVIDLELNDPREYPDKTASEYETLKRLEQR